MVIIAHDDDEIARYLRVDDYGRLYVLLSDGATTAHVDPETGGLTVSRAVHRRVMQSNTWITSYIKVALAAGASFFLHLKVDATLNAHVNFTVQCEAKVYYFFYEDPTLTDDGTALTEVCINRQDVGVATMEVFRDPTITANGLLLETGLIGSVGHFTAAGGQADLGGYWLLEKAESYLIRVDNLDAAAKDIAISVVWHEE